MKPTPTRDQTTAAQTFARTLHRLALLAYPSAFRRDFGPELHAIFEARQATAGSGTRAAGLAILEAVDAVATGVGERVRLAAARYAWPGRTAAEGMSRSRTMSVESLLADVKFAFRQFRRTPLFALVTALTLAVGIGANSAIFGVVYSVLWRPLPYVNPDTLVMIWSDNTRLSEPDNPVSPANFEAFRLVPSLAAAEAMYSFLIPVQIRLGADPEVVQASAVTPGMLDLLGRPPLLGRTFQATDTTVGAVLSYEYWRRRFGGDPAIVGQVIPVDGQVQRVTVLGVMPEGFAFPYRSMLGPVGILAGAARRHLAPPDADVRLHPARRCHRSAQPQRPLPRRRRPARGGDDRRSCRGRPRDGGRRSRAEVS